MHLQPAHFRRINLLAKQPGLAMQFFAFGPVNRGVEGRVGELGIQRGLFLIPLGQLAFQLLDLFDQRPPLGQ